MDYSHLTTAALWTTLEEQIALLTKLDRLAERNAKAGIAMISSHSRVVANVEHRSNGILAELDKRGATY